MEEDVKVKYFPFTALTYPTPNTLIDTFREISTWCEDNSTERFEILSLHLYFDQENMGGSIDVFYKYQ